MYIGRFKSEEFKKMKYDPVNTKGFMKDTYKEFNVPLVFTVDSGVELPINDQMIRYVILVFSADSPLRNIKELIDRKREALKIIDFPSNMEASQIVNNEHDVFMRVCSAYLRMVDNMLWSLRMSAEEAFYMLIEKMRSPIDNDLASDKEKSAYQSLRLCMEDAQKIMAEIKKMDDELEKAGKEVHNYILKEHRQQSKNLMEAAVLDGLDG